MLRTGFILILAIMLALPAEAQTSNPQKTARVTYAEPSDPAHRPIREEMKSRQVLEKIRQVLSVFRLPKPVALQLTGCKGEADAWYEADDRTITVCYEYIAELLQQAPAEGAGGAVDRRDAIMGPVLEVFLHESGHALFETFRLPILGREEDAADQFAAFLMLQLEDNVARRMIMGVGHMYLADGKAAPAGVARYADEHAVPEQRFYNLMCMALGAKPGLFADAVEKKYLTADRAVGCAQEYQQIAYAMTKLLGPQIDKVELEKLGSRGKQWKPQALR